MSPSAARLIVFVLLAAAAESTAGSSVVQQVKTVPAPDRKINDTRVLKTDCSLPKIRELLEPASEAQPGVSLDCSLELKPGQTITKRISFAGLRASGSTLDCGGSTIIPTFYEGPGYQFAAIEVRGRSNMTSDFHPDAPKDVTIRNCVIHGSINIRSEMPFVDSDKKPDHTARMQAQAPRNITLDRLTIIGRGSTLVYMRSGVTHSTLSNSELRGAAGIAIYLDAESAHNTIKGNYFHPESNTRQLIAVDGSAHNRIIGNRFSSLNTGGIYLYRNCGELGIVRHQSPMHNEIVNNHFYYRLHDDDDFPAIWVGRRNDGRTERGSIGYCDDDQGFPFGSSKSDRDFAQHNVIAENRISRIEGWGYDQFFKIDDDPTYVIRNVRVGNDEIALLDKSSMRPSGCFRLGLLEGEGLRDKGIFVRHGQYLRNLTKNTKSLDLLKTGDLTDRLLCDDGTWRNGGQADIARVSAEVSASTNNSGARGIASCPAGKKIVSFRASCNLELAQVPGLSMVPWNRLQVRRKSDRIEAGTCAVSYRWSASENRSVSIKLGSATLEELLSAHVSEAGLHCRDEDKNGGDCFIRSEAICM